VKSHVNIFSTTSDPSHTFFPSPKVMISNASATVGVEFQRHVEAASKRQRLTLIIVDGDCRVLFDSIGPTEHELRLLLSDDRRKLHRDVALVVQALIAHCLQTGERHSRIAFLDTHRFVRVTRLDGRDGSLFAVSVEFFRGADSLSRAARKYQLTPREIDVLAMILEGASAIETAHALSIAETTVQGYYKRLLSKTRSRNRPAMVANVLDWGGSGREQVRGAEPSAISRRKKP
jgi:DNA-binding CsgD family transcriptional regulator